MQSNNWKKNITLFLTSQAISLLGSSTVQFAISWYVAREMKSGLMFALVTLCGFLPQVLVSLFAGVWADRYSRKMLIVLADGGIALVTLALAIIISRSGGVFWALLVVSVIRSVGAGIQTPTVNAAIPQLVPKEQLMRIGGLNSSIQSVIFLISPALAGAVLSWGAFQYVLFIDVLTAMIGISVMLFLVPLKKLERPEGAEQNGYFDDLKEGVSYVTGNPFLRRVLLVCGVFCFLLVPAAFYNVPMVTQVFGGSYWYLTLNEIAFSVGAVIGGLILGAWGGFPNRLKTLGWGGLAFGITTVGIGLVHTFWVYLIVIALAGFAMPFNNSPLMVLLQEKSAPEKQGRVFSLLQIVSTLVMQAGVLVFGLLSDIVPIQTLMVFSGVGLILMTVAVFRWKRFYSEGVTLPPLPAEAVNMEDN